MRKLFSIVTIASLFAMPLFSQKEEKPEKLQSLENNSDTAANENKPVLEIGDKVFSIQETAALCLNFSKYRFYGNNSIINDTEIYL